MHVLFNLHNSIRVNIFITVFSVEEIGTQRGPLYSQSTHRLKVKSEKKR